MATAVHRDHLSGGEGIILNPGTGIAFDIEVSECVSSNSPVPKWLRQRLEENLEYKAKSLEDIETRLKEADLRRQVTYHVLQALELQFRIQFGSRSDMSFMFWICSNFMNGWQTRHGRSGG